MSEADHPKDLTPWTSRPVDRALERLTFFFMGTSIASSVISSSGVMALPVAAVGAISAVALMAIIFVRFARGSFGIPSESQPGGLSQSKNRR